MSLIIVSDIFGITPSLLKLKDELGAMTIVDPYQGKFMGFKNEAEAYSTFIETVGLDNYIEHLSSVLVSLDNEVTLIGFSVGASAIWRISESNEGSSIKQAFCFYGSQIRNSINVEPCFKVNIIFPQSETHFDVSKLKEALSQKPNVAATQVKYLHGFMNVESNNFNITGYQEQMSILQSIKS